MTEDNHLAHTIGYYETQHSWMNIYEVDREFGGPEEGGWYYDTGEVEVSIPLHDLDADEVFALYNLMLKAFPRTGASSSVVRREGDWRIVFSDTRGVNYPEERPLYR